MQTRDNLGCPLLVYCLSWSCIIHTCSCSFFAVRTVKDFPVNRMWTTNGSYLITLRYLDRSNDSLNRLSKVPMQVHNKVDKIVNSVSVIAPVQLTVIGVCKIKFLHKLKHAGYLDCLSRRLRHSSHRMREYKRQLTVSVHFITFSDQ